MTKHKEALDALVVLYNAKAINTDNETMRAAYETVEKALQAASWQDIETAPKDRVILIRNKTGTVFSGQWAEEENGWMMTGALQVFYSPKEWREMDTAAPVDGGG